MKNKNFILAIPLPLQRRINRIVPIDDILEDENGKIREEKLLIESIKQNVSFNLLKFANILIKFVFFIYLK